MECLANKMQNIEEIDRNSCVGCWACYNKCPVEAIRMEYDNEGFAYPVIDYNKCIDCGQCVKVCPTKIKKTELQQQKYYAVTADEKTRLNSSSGGMFTIIAEYVLGLKGVICGCTYSDDYRSVYHTVIDNLEDLEALKKSKYVQSEIRDCFSKIKSALNEEKWVLFSGTPCQVAGLYSYLGKEYKKLITADIVCHGVPSLLAYNAFLDEYSDGRRITKVDFRDKRNAKWGTVEYIEFEDGTSYYNDCYKGKWYPTFLNGISTRPSCATCQYSYKYRPGDFTLGDFWGYKSVDKCLDDSYGVSLVITNTRKASKLINRLLVKCSWKEINKNTVLELAKTRNGNLLHPTIKHYSRERFFELLKKKKFSEAADDTINAKYDIGIVGWWYNLNYGGALTYYALHQVLKKLGYSVIMIARCSDDLNYKPDKTSIPYRFALKHYYISKTHSHMDMDSLNNHCKIFISGSDQLFNPVLWQYSGPEYFLDFVNNENLKISYASSFGNTYVEVGNLKSKMNYWLHRFNAISVREDYGEKIISDNFGLEAQKVLDPVFLCDQDEYKKIVKESHVEEKTPFFVSFILDPTDEKRDIIVYLENKYKKKSINLINADNINQNKERLNLNNIMANADIEDWLYFYSNADFIFTDSFHGTCFAIIFNKPFISYANIGRGVNRFISLLSEFNLLDRLVYSMNELVQKVDLLEWLNYEKINQELTIKREKSINWLESAIHNKDNKVDDFDIVDFKIYELEKRIRKLENIIKKQ